MIRRQNSCRRHKSVGTLCSMCQSGEAMRFMTSLDPGGFATMTTSMPRALLGKIDPRAWAGLIAGSFNSNIVPFAPGRLKPAMRQRRAENVGLPQTLGRIGSLEVRLARSAKEVKKAQRLRFQVFYEEMSAIPDAVSMFSRRDRDAYDAICDHLLVLDHNVPAAPFRKAKPRVVGTYRLLRQGVAEAHGGFYTAAEFDIEPLV